MNKLLRISIILLLLTALFMSLNSQPRQSRGGTIRGVLIDEVSGKPVEYANVLLFTSSDSARINGDASSDDGSFEITGIRPGKYYAEVHFLGYTVSSIEDITIGRGSLHVDLGEIRLQESAIELEGVSVASEKPSVIYQIDKKVINVSEQLTVVSGSAVDVLENVPSVTVDTDDNVQLRGSSSFTVLIDGRPTILDPNDALRQQPASSIETIEIITNPSAKYDPDGVAGIINLVLKKGKSSGTSGVANASVGSNDQYSGDFLLNLRKEKYNVQLGLDYNQRRYPSDAEEIYKNFGSDTTYITESFGESFFQRKSYGAKAGIEHFLDENDVLSYSVRWGGRGMEHGSDMTHTLSAEPGTAGSPTTSSNKTERGGNHFSGNIDYKHSFDNNGDGIFAQVIVSRRDGDEETVNRQYDQSGNLISGRKSTEKGPSEQLRLKLDYTKSFGEKRKVEAGYQSRFGTSEDRNQTFQIHPIAGLILQPQFNSETKYIRNINSVYGIYADEAGKIGYQGGLRMEHTSRSIESNLLTNDFEKDRWNLFPSAHLSYHMTGVKQLMASYSRRIDRPRGWYFEPFETWMDAYNVRRGNPNLKPEYIDSFEAGFQNYIGRNLFSAEAFYRVTHNKIERVRSAYDVNITLHSTENVGSDYSFGTELRLNIDPVRWWNVNLMGTLYDYRVEGELNDTDYSEESFNWSARFNNTLNFNRSSRLQVNTIYNSATATSQGTEKASSVTNIGYRQEFMDNNLAATLQINDVFQTHDREQTYEGDDFYSSRSYDRDAPTYSLTLSYNFNNHKQERRKRSGGTDYIGDDEDF